jgi:hypothetical protein
MGVMPTQSSVLFAFSACVVVFAMIAARVSPFAKGGEGSSSR